MTVDMTAIPTISKEDLIYCAKCGLEITDERMDNNKWKERHIENCINNPNKKWKHELFTL